MVSALLRKADHEEVNTLAKHLNQIGKEAWDDNTILTKRPLLGKCASCDVPLQSDVLQKRPQTVSEHGQMQPRWSPGAHFAIRLPEARPIVADVWEPSHASSSSVPKLPGFESATKDFPKGKVRKNKSQSDFRFAQ